MFGFLACRSPLPAESRSNLRFNSGHRKPIGAERNTLEIFSPNFIPLLLGQIAQLSIVRLVLEMAADWF
jgi:hypothetical protein